MQATGRLSRQSYLVGASGGGIASASYMAGVSPAALLDFAKRLSSHTRQHGLWWRVHDPLKALLTVRVRRAPRPWRLVWFVVDWFRRAVKECALHSRDALEFACPELRRVCSHRHSPLPFRKCLKKLSSTSLDSNMLFLFLPQSSELERG